MQTSDMIRQLCKYKNISITELCRRIGQTTQNFSKKLKRNTVTLEELGSIARSLGVRYEQRFVMADDETIGITLENNRSTFAMSDNVLAANAGTSLLESLFESVYYIDLDDDAYYVRFRRDWLDRKYPRGGSYYEQVCRWIRQDLFAEDQEMMLSQVSAENIRERLRDQDSFSVIYRDNHTGVPRYQEMKVIRADNETPPRYVSVCFIDRDELVRTTQRNEQEQLRLRMENARIAQRNTELKRDYQMLLSAINLQFKMSIYINLTQNDYHMIEYEHYSTKKAPESGAYDELLRIGASTLPHEEDRRKFTELFDREAMLRAYRSGKTHLSLIVRQLGDNGRIYWIESTCILGQDENGDVLAISLSRDVSEEMTRANELRRNHEVIVNLANSCVSIYEVDTREDSLKILHLNDVSSRIFRDGYKQRIAGKKYSEIFPVWVTQSVHPEDKVRMLRELAPETIAENLQKNSYYVRTYRETQPEAAYYEMRVQRLTDDDGGISTKALVSFFDVDAETRQRLDSADKLARALEEARTANDAKRRFLFNMSHDIRTPMNAIIGFTDMAIRNKQNPAKLAHSLDQARVSEQQLLQLINDVLLMSHMDNDLPLIEEKPADLIEAVQQLSAVIQEEAREKKLHFSVSTRSLVDRYVVADMPHVCQILLGILNNAIRFTPASGSVSFLLEQLEDPAPDIASFLFTIEDTGVGMSKELLEHVFEPFVREAPPDARSAPGIGLGLSIAMRLANLMGGSIEADSTVGVGSVFRVYLTFSKSPAAAEQKSAEEKDIKPLAGLHIMVVDDNELNREIVVDILHEFGATVSEAINGLEAVNLYLSSGKGTFSAILMDIQMPVMDGYTATQRIRKCEETTGVRTPIIALSANAFEDDKRRSREVGMDAHLEKPMEPAKLTVTLLSHIHRAQEAER